MNHTLKLLRAAALALLPALAACAAPQPRLFLLSNNVAPPPAPAGAAARPLLVVRTVALPEYLDRRAVIYRSSDAELKRFDDVIWAERPGESVTRWVAQQLAADLPEYAVEAFTVHGDRSPGLVLNIDLQSFEPDASAGPAVTLRLRGNWHLSGAASADGQLSADAPMSTLDPAATVAAMRSALTVAIDGVAARIHQLPPPARK
ncbi:MAG TPA: PqiC family protein [Nevskia sp.]|nr:PqiC family protein [Nevskia sp.]